MEIEENNQNGFSQEGTPASVVNSDIEGLQSKLK
jgi:hypothetical protein